MTARTPSAIAIGLLMALPLYAGCGGGGPELGSVSGTVKLGGQPLPRAKVEFQPEKGGSPSYAMTDEKGYYELSFSADRRGALIGKHKVAVSTYQQQSNPDGTTSEIPERVPAQFTSQATTPLVKEVQAGSQTIDIDVPF